MKKALKIVLIVIVCLVALLGLFILGYNVFKRAIYPEYYQIQTDLAPNQGLGDGYVPQDLTSYKYNDNIIYFTCGYMTSKDKPSRIYMIRDNEKEKYFELKDEKYLNLLRNKKIIVVVSSGAYEEESLKETYELEEAMKNKAIPACFYYWTNNYPHNFSSWKIYLSFYIKEFLN